MNLGSANWLLSIKITRDFDTQTIFLSQSSYINFILTCFNFSNLKPIATPMDPSFCFSKEQCPQTLEEVAEMCKVLYQEVIGLLNYCAVAI